MAEFRRSIRKTIAYPAWVDTGQGSLMPCELQDASDDGAKLFLGDPWRLPDAFLLRLSPTAQTARVCSVRWRADRLLGVKFLRGKAAPGSSAGQVRLTICAPRR